MTPPARRPDGPPTAPRRPPDGPIPFNRRAAPSGWHTPAMRPTNRAPSASGAGGFLVVAAAAALWGTDALFRRGLALEWPAVTVVFGEHLLLVALTFPLLMSGWRAARGRFRRGDWLALLVIGAGASAVATVMFTQAFSYGDTITVLLLQKLQPLFAVVGARLLLGERLTARYPLYFVAALLGAWLVAFPEPLAVRASTLAPALLAGGAAALWALGTVLGRRLSPLVTFGQLTALRFGVGLPAAAVLLVAVGDVVPSEGFGGGDLVALLLLTLVPGLLGIALYYRGLRRTPAALATLAELAFPLTALVVGFVVFGETLSGTQWVGLALLAGTITALGLASRRSAESAGVIVTRDPATPVGVR